MATSAIDSNGNKCEVFWGEIAPCEHMVQIYQNEGVFLDSLEGFVAGGMRAGDGVVVIAVSAHLAALENRLLALGIDLTEPKLSDQYIALRAEEVLAKFMVRNWPDEYLFEQVVSDLLKRAGKGGRRVRAFGEMVAMLWNQGHTGATVRLEHLWHKLCHEKAFSLFCAYPIIGFTQNADSAMKEICDAHSKVIAG